MQKLWEFICFRIFYAIFYLFYLSYRFKSLREHRRIEAQNQHPKGAYFLACWHEQLVGVTMAQKGHPFRPLASRSFGGRLMGYTLQKFGFPPVYGSQKRNGRDKGGKLAREELLALAGQGLPSAYTVDGSKGPRRKVKPGVVDLSRRSGAAILPVASVADRYWEFSTWDRFKLPKPFARIVTSYGQPIKVPAQLSAEEFDAFLAQVELGINEAEQQALACLHQNAKENLGARGLVKMKGSGDSF